MKSPLYSLPDYMWLTTWVSGKGWLYLWQHINLWWSTVCKTSCRWSPGEQGGKLSIGLLVCYSVYCKSLICVLNLYLSNSVWKGRIRGSREREKGSRRRGYYLSHFSVNIWTYMLNDLLSFSPYELSSNYPWLIFLQEARKAREEGERRRKERDSRYRDRRHRRRVLSCGFFVP